MIKASKSPTSDLRSHYDTKPNTNYMEVTDFSVSEEKKGRNIGLSHYYAKSMKQKREAEIKPITKKKQSITKTPVADKNEVESSESEVNFHSSPRTTEYVEGKLFFKSARKELPSDQFSELIKQIQLMNKGKQTKEQTLAVAEKLLGRENNDLYKRFKDLLLHKISS